MKKFIGRAKRDSTVSPPSQISAPEPDTASSYTTAASAPVPRSVNAHNPYAQADEYSSSASDGDYNPYASSYSSRSVNESSYVNPYESAQPRTNPYDVSRSSAAYQTSQLPPRSSGSSQTSYSASSSYGGNAYGASESATTARSGYTAKQPEDDTVSIADSTRRELFRGVDNGRQKPRTLANYPSKSPTQTQIQTQTQMYIEPESSTYDPSIMETEAERAARYGETPSATTSGANSSSTVDFDDLREQDEQREVESLRKQIREVKIDSLSTAQRALLTAEEAEASAIRTMERLDDQRSRLGSIDNSLSVSGSQIQIGDSHVNELRTINRSMFAVHVSKPWSSQRRLQERDQKIRDSFASQQQARDLNNSQQAQSRARLNDAKSAQFRRAPQRQQGQQRTTTASRYQFEPDDEDFELENDIESTLDSVGAASSRLNAIASTIGSELDSQISYIERLGDKSTKVESDINLTTVKLSRIH
ncbi:hypothetical protein BZA70DRAFT_143491 [Myxozyma melibiosi]|uniref:t-SNARE coiled-coil homology domain-containing protein n=1 Tax=Myxozyma melibiosi TaxID=54550 RepID=A0ABR1F7T8_9ASCO